MTIFMVERIKNHVRLRVDVSPSLLSIVCVSGHDCWQDGVEDGGVVTPVEKEGEMTANIGERV